MKIVTVLKVGGEYNEGHVKWLVDQLQGHDVICLTDSILNQKKFLETTGAHKLELRYNAWGHARKWWAKMEMFRPELKALGDFLYIDLDTVILKREFLDFDLGPTPIVLADFYFPGTSIGSGLMWLPESCRADIWERWIACPEEHMARHHGDQDFLTPYLWPSDRWQNFFPFAVVSYKAHLSPDDGQQFYKKGFDDFSKISVVCFHGSPRPFNLDLPWIPK